MHLTERMVSDFREHAVWRQIASDVMERIALLKEELSTLDPVHQVVEMCRHQGRIDGMFFVIGALDDYAIEAGVQKVERDEENKRRKKKEEEI